MDALLSAAIEAAKAGGEIARHYFRTNLSVETKADRTPVTRADRECEACITELLSRRFPEHGFLGEELGEQPSANDARWIIDPIDGTRNFIRGIPFFATLIALEEAAQITVGVMYVPARPGFRCWAFRPGDAHPRRPERPEDPSLLAGLFIPGGCDRPPARVWRRARPQRGDLWPGRGRP